MPRVGLRFAKVVNSYKFPYVWEHSTVRDEDLTFSVSPVDHRIALDSLPHRTAQLAFTAEFHAL